MKKINWKLFHLALWTELVLSYFLPFKATNDFQYHVGFPMSFLSVFDTKWQKSPFLSTHLNPFGLLLDVFIIYLILAACVNGYQKFRKRFRE